MLYKMILLFSLMIGFSAQAMVSLESGEYSVSAVDLEIANNQLPFKLFRFYNHRARPQGIFGSKWCSNLEQEIRSNARGYIGFACGLPTQMLFVKNDKIKLKNKDQAYAWNSETLIKLGNGKGYIRYTQENTVLTYDDRGKLTSISPKIQRKHPLIRLHYDNGLNRLQKIVYDGKDQYIIKYNANSQIERIQGPKGAHAKYKYSQDGVMTEVRNFWRNTYQYSYDEQKRIVQISYPQNRTEKVTYDPKLNVVAQTVDVNDCKTDYKRDLNNRLSTMKLTMINDCKSKPRIFETAKSPLFFKNKLTIEKISQSKGYHSSSRIPASLPREQAIQKVKQIQKPDYVYKFILNDQGQTVQIAEFNKKLNRQVSLKLEYKDQQLTALSSAKLGRLNYVYTAQGALVKSYSDDQKTETKNSILDVYSRFLLAYEQAQKEGRP
jgi:hypothetical protein